MKCCRTSTEWVTTSTTTSQKLKFCVTCEPFPNCFCSKWSTTFDYWSTSLSSARLPTDFFSGSADLWSSIRPACTLSMRLKKSSSGTVGATVCVDEELGWIQSDSRIPVAANCFELRPHCAAVPESDGPLNVSVVFSRRAGHYSALVFQTAVSEIASTSRRSHRPGSTLAPSEYWREGVTRRGLPGLLALILGKSCRFSWFTILLFGWTKFWFRCCGRLSGPLVALFRRIGGRVALWSSMRRPCIPAIRSIRSWKCSALDWDSCDDWPTLPMWLFMACGALLRSLLGALLGLKSLSLFSSVLLSRIGCANCLPAIGWPQIGFRFSLFSIPVNEHLWSSILFALEVREQVQENLRDFYWWRCRYCRMSLSVD